MTPDEAAYRVLVDDNFHYGNEDERYQAGAFDSYEHALAKCRSIVEECLAEQLKPGMAAEELYAAYMMFGEDPWISAVPEDAARFSVGRSVPARTSFATPSRRNERAGTPAGWLSRQPPSLRRDDSAGAFELREHRVEFRAHPTVG